MSEVIVLFRVPPIKLQSMTEDDGCNIAVFNSDEEAEKAVDDHPFIKYQDYEIVEINV